MAEFRFIQFVYYCPWYSDRQVARCVDVLVE